MAGPLRSFPTRIKRLLDGAKATPPDLSSGYSFSCMPSLFLCLILPIPLSVADKVGDLLSNSLENMEFTFGDAGLYHHHPLPFTGREEHCGGSEMMEFQFQGFEFWPVEHPLEPLDEDTPVKCPLPAASPINERGAAELAREATVRVRMRGAAPVRAVRKRQHTLSGSEQVKDGVAPLPPLQPQNNITVFQVLQ